MDGQDNQMPHIRILQIILFFVTAILYLGFSWSSILGGFGGDNANYLLMARHYSLYSPPSAVADYFTAHSFYPPLFPFLLSLTGGGESLLAAHLTTTSFLLMACLTFYWWLRNETLGRLTATATCLALMSVPGLYLQTLSIHSENLFLLFTLAALGCTTAAQVKMKSRWLWLAAVLIVASYLTRSAGIALIVAWLAWVWTIRPPQRWALSASVLLSVLLWKLVGSAGASDYWHQLSNGYAHLDALLSQIQSQGHYLLNGWHYNFGYGYIPELAGTMLLILGIIATLWRTWLRKLDGYYAVCYWLMVVMWPFPAEAQRMTLVILPVMFGQAVWLASQWQPESKRTLQPIKIVLFLIVFTATLPELAHNTQRFFSPLPPNVPQAYRHTELWYIPELRDAHTNVIFYSGMENSLNHIDEIVPEQACIISVKPSITAYLSGRISKPPPAPKVSETEFLTEVKKLDCRYFYLTGTLSPTYSVALYPLHRLGNELEVMDGENAAVPGTQLPTYGILARLKEKS